MFIDLTAFKEENFVVIHQDNRNKEILVTNILC